MDRPSIKAYTQTISKELKAGLFFSFFINLLMLVSPIFMLQAYDRVLPSRSELTLLMLLILAVFLLFILGFLDSLRYRLMSKAASILDQSLAPAVFRSILEVNRLKPASGGTQYLTELQHIKQFLSGAPICVFFDAPWVPLFVLCNYIIHPLLGTITLLGALTIFVLAYLNERMSRATTEKAQMLSGTAQQYAEQAVAKSQTAQALGMMSALEHKWLSARQEANQYTDQSNIQAGAFSASTKAYRLILQTFILAAGCWLAIEQEITAGAMIAASIIMGRALAPVEQAIGTWRIFVKARSAYHRIDQLLSAFPAPTLKIRHERPLGDIHVDKLIVVPPESKKPVLKGVSFNLPAGKRLMIGGESASGKTTLLKSLAGIWPAHSGSIKIDSVELSQWNRQDLGQHLGYLPQNVDFLPGSIADNIARFQDHEDSEVLAAAKFAGVHEVITQLADGYDTSIGADGSPLSSGQKQLIGLARTVFRQPQIVLLDEPNAHLDQRGCALFNTFLARLGNAGITTIVVSHKRDVLSQVDYYLEIKFGQTAVFSKVAPKTKETDKA